ncbi:MAG: hypothetical protein ACI3VR_03015 [Intestinibacter sp.]|uniref:stage II sporulation protein M n=1 Tax=Intestinibacter sp. TaxID=1965304 RepID=UPI003F17CF87
MGKKDKNTGLIIVSLIFMLFVVVGVCLNKFDSCNVENISIQIGEIRNYYSGNIDIKDFIFMNIKEYTRYLGSIGILSLLFFTFPLAVIVFVVKAISIGYTINTCILMFGFSSIKMCTIVFLKNIIMIPISIILIILSIQYVKNIFKQLKKKRQDSILSLGKRFLFNLIIIMFSSIILQSLLNIIGISIIQFLAR